LYRHSEGNADYVMRPATKLLLLLVGGPSAGAFLECRECSAPAQLALMVAHSFDTRVSSLNLIGMAGRRPSSCLLLSLFSPLTTLYVIACANKQSTR
jgi:hypothetical protein